MISVFAISTTHYLVVAALLFAFGAAGAILRRNALVILMSIELMLNACNLLFVAYAKQFGAAGGHALATLVMAIAAAEAAVGLAIILGVFRTRQTVDVDEFDTLRDET